MSMPRYFFIILLMVCFGSATITPRTSHAHVYEWSDPVSHITFRVPDKWRIVPNENIKDLVTFRAPGQNQHVSCSLRATEDKRYAMFPEPISDHVNNIYLGYDFWNTMGTMEYRTHWLNNVQKRMGLGNGFALMADMTFTPMNMPMNKRGLIWASLYNGTLYMLQCSSEISSFYTWYPSFQYILGTVRTDKEIHELPTGNYRYFLGDDLLQVNTFNGQTSRH